MYSDEDDKNQVELSPKISDIFAIGFVFTKLILLVRRLQKPRCLCRVRNFQSVGNAT